MGALGKEVDGGGDDGGQGGHHLVAAGPGDGVVELDVLVHIVFPVHNVLFHDIVKPVQLGNVLRRGMAGGHLGNGRLDDGADLQQVLRQLPLVLEEGKAQGVCGEAGVIGHKGPGAVADAENILGFQAFDGFPNGAAGNIHFLGQGGLRGQFVAAFQFLFQNILLKPLRHLLGQGTALIVHVAAHSGMCLLLTEIIVIIVENKGSVKIKLRIEEMNCFTGI